MAATSAAVADLSLTIAGPFEAADALRWYEASPGVFYGFCATCGSSLFWRNDDEPERWSIGAGTLDAPTGLDTTLSIWTAESSDYHEPVTGPSHEYD